jgi:hypothetical protein
MTAENIWSGRADSPARDRRPPCRRDRPCDAEPGEGVAITCDALDGLRIGKRPDSCGPAACRGHDSGPSVGADAIAAGPSPPLEDSWHHRSRNSHPACLPGGSRRDPLPAVRHAAFRSGSHPAKGRSPFSGTDRH